MTTRCCVKEAGGQSPTKSWVAERKKLQREVKWREVEKEHSMKHGEERATRMVCRSGKRCDGRRKVVQLGKSAGMACDMKQEGSPRVALRCRCDPVPVTDSTSWLQRLRDLPGLGTGLSAGCQGTQPLGLSCPPTLGRGFPLLPCVFQPQQKGAAVPA